MIYHQQLAKVCRPGGLELLSKAGGMKNGLRHYNLGNCRKSDLTLTW